MVDSRTVYWANQPTDPINEGMYITVTVIPYVSLDIHNLLVLVILTVPPH